MAAGATIPCSAVLAPTSSWAAGALTPSTAVPTATTSRAGSEPTRSTAVMETTSSTDSTGLRATTSSRVVQGPTTNVTLIRLTKSTSPPARTSSSKNPNSLELYQPGGKPGKKDGRPRDHHPGPPSLHVCLCDLFAGRGYRFRVYMMMG